MLKNKLPMEWVDRIFMRLHGRFGNAFLDRYKIGDVRDGQDLGILNAKEVWSEDCGHLTAERIKKGLEAKYTYPPTCDEFIANCNATPEMYLDNKLLQLPHKRNPEVSKEGLDKIATVISQTLKPKTDYKAWAKRILANPQNFPDQSVAYAKEALGYDKV
jgi:hypothetical protein